MAKRHVKICHKFIAKNKPMNYKYTHTLYGNFGSDVNMILKVTFDLK